MISNHFSIPYDAPKGYWQGFWDANIQMMNMTPEEAELCLAKLRIAVRGLP